MPAMSAWDNPAGQVGTSKRASPKVPSLTKNREERSEKCLRTAGRRVGHHWLPDPSGEPVGSHTGRRRQGQLKRVINLSCRERPVSEPAGPTSASARGPGSARRTPRPHTVESSAQIVLPPGVPRREPHARARASTIKRPRDRSLVSEPRCPDHGNGGARVGDFYEHRAVKGATTRLKIRFPRGVPRWRPTRSRPEQHRRAPFSKEQGCHTRRLERHGPQ